MVNADTLVVEVGMSEDVGGAAPDAIDVELLVEDVAEPSVTDDVLSDCP